MCIYVFYVTMYICTSVCMFVCRTFEFAAFVVVSFTCRVLCYRGVHGACRGLDQCVHCCCTLALGSGF